MLFVPETPYFKNINALYLEIKQKPKKSAQVVLLQITMADTYKDSEALFYLEQWARFQAHFEGYALSTTFVWIVEDLPRVEGRGGGDQEDEKRIAYGYATTSAGCHSCEGCACRSWGRPYTCSPFNCAVKNQPCLPVHSRRRDR